MELVFEIVSALQSVPAVPSSKTFRQAGGVIGRHPNCDWVIHDPTHEVSKQHATISYRAGAYYLTDISTNGTQLMDDGAQLGKGAPHRIADGNVFRLATFLIRARLVESQARADHASAAPALIPDGAFLDPLSASGLANGVRLGEASEAPVQPADHTRVEIGNLPLPVLVPESQPTAATPSPQPADRFWQNFASELGLDLDELDENARQALALKTAHLLRQCIGGLQQSLRTRTELKNELRLALTTLQNAGDNPLKHCPDTDAALAALLHPRQPGQLSAGQAVKRAFRDLQAHQVALLGASRTAMRGALDHFAPERLTVRLKHDGHLPRLCGAAGRWRAYGRYYQRLRQDDEWSERLLARDFAQAYEEQVRLIESLHGNAQG